MAQQQQRPKIVSETSGQEGSRWVGARPTGEQVAAWFGTVSLDEGMNHADHVGGITIISAKETRLEIVNGTFTDVERLVHVPYPRVDSRISYFWQLCELRGWIGEIEPVVQHSSPAPLPPGFGKLAVPTGENTVAAFLTCTQQVRIYDPSKYGSSRHGGLGMLIRSPAPATKQLPLVNRWNRPDENAMMRCETGAVGRALGMAGIFVLPGAGVATAEDMQDFLQSSGAGTSSDVEPELPSESTPEINVAERIAELRGRLDETQQGEFADWASGRGFDMAALRETQERAVLRWLEQRTGD